MISYNTDGVKMPAIKKRANNNWIKAVAECYGKKVGDIAYIFVDDEKMKPIYKKISQLGLICVFHSGRDYGFMPPYKNIGSEQTIPPARLLYRHYHL